MTPTQEKQIIELLWDSLRRDPSFKDRRETGWGTKTQKGLIACIGRIVRDEDKHTCSACLNGHHEDPIPGDCTCPCHGRSI